MRKESPKEVPKVWGSEIWLVNSDKYCAKYLNIKKGAQGSLHFHKEKEETFFCLSGCVELYICGDVIRMIATSEPITIEPNDIHSIKGLEESVILEISTTHDDNDVFRLRESHGVVGEDEV